MKKRQNLKSGVSPLVDISNNNILFSDILQRKYVKFIFEVNSTK